MIELRPYQSEDLAKISNWYSDSQTRKWLGDKTWLDNVERLLSEPVGTEFRGAKRISYHPYIVTEDEKAVGFIDAGISDKYVVWGIDASGEQGVLSAEDVLTAGITFMVDPAQRGKGLAAKMLRNLLDMPELANVVVFEAGVEPDNQASVKSLMKAGFEPEGEVDFEGMQYYKYDRRIK
ncbi:GNAT family N-acetyltransferase [Candidatus Saccharibacteria bacterium]|nr:GNAT family N-acetyltransferase [Candidatus Saccharibacteria bacterium]MCB9821005.1 GNAT family N-acetyltransferase [Candidatus Nomurabacteria bacterium]